MSGNQVNYSDVIADNGTGYTIPMPPHPAPTIATNAPEDAVIANASANPANVAAYAQAANQGSATEQQVLTALQNAAQTGGASSAVGSDLTSIPTTTTSTASGGSSSAMPIFVIGLLVVLGIAGYVWYRHQHHGGE